MKQPVQRVLLDISWESLLKVVGLVLGLWVTYFLRDVLIMLFVVFILVAALNPTVTRLQRYMSRTLAVALVYAVLALIIGIVFSSIVPTLISQFNDLAHSLPEILDKAGPLFQSLHSERYPDLADQAMNSIVASVNHYSNNLLETGISLVGGLATAVTGLVISFYLLLEEKNAREFFHQLLPHHRFEAVYNTVSKVSERMGGWVRGQMIIMLVIAVSNFVAYLVVGLHAPLPLAIWAGVCELIPIIGSYLGLVPAVAVALSTGGVVQAVLVLLITVVVIQQFEMHIVVPRVMGRAVGLSPVLVILSLLIGAKLFGLVGALIAVPAAAVLSVVVGEWPNLRKIWETAD